MLLEQNRVPCAQESRRICSFSFSRRTHAVRVVRNPPGALYVVLVLSPRYRKNRSPFVQSASVKAISKISWTSRPGIKSAEVLLCTIKPYKLPSSSPSFLEIVLQFMFMVFFEAFSPQAVKQPAVIKSHAWEKSAGKVPLGSALVQIVPFFLIFFSSMSSTSSDKQMR